MKIILGVMCGVLLLIAAFFLFEALIVELPLAIGFSRVSWLDIARYTILPSAVMFAVVALNGLAIKSLMANEPRKMWVFITLALADVALAGFALLAGVGIGRIRPDGGGTLFGVLEAVAVFLLIKAIFGAVMAARIRWSPAPAG